MTIPFWCLFAGVLLPYVWFAFAAPWRAAQFGQALNSRAPRLQDSELAGRAARAQGAHYNSLEALAYFAPAVIVAHLTHASASWSARLALLFVACRVAHGLAYLADRQPLRTAFFAVGLLSSLALFVLSACA
ncbi:MAG: MAPEG family protein [Pseudomonadota bacterium]